MTVERPLEGRQLAASGAQPVEVAPGQNHKHRKAASASSRRALLASAFYSIGFILQRALGMMLLPLYTRAVSPREYGTLGVLLSVSMAMFVLFSVGLDAAVTRNYFQLAREPAKREEYIASVWRFLVVFPLGASVLLGGVGYWISPVAGASGTDTALMLAATALNVAGATVPLAVLRARQDVRAYLKLTVATSLATPALTWLFVVELHDGIGGWFLGASLANAATLIVALKLVPWRRGVPYKYKYVKAAMIFSLPLVPHFLSHWALQVADRLVISGMVSPTNLGVYTLAATLAAPMFALLQALNSGFLPFYGRAGAEAGHESALADAVVVQIVITIGITLAAALLGGTAVLILTPNGYHGAASIVAWLMLGNGFVGLYFVPMNGATVGAGRRVFAFIGTMAAAVTNIALLVWLVPAGGIRAAAIADAIAYFLMFVLMSVWSHSKPTPVHYRWVPIIAAVCVAILAYTGAELTAPAGIWPRAAVQTAWIAAYVLGVLGWLRWRNDLRRLRRHAATYIVAE